MTARAGRALLAGALALLLGACALLAGPGRVAIGTPAAQALQALGPPTARYPGPAGERLQYSQEPAGQRVFNLDLDLQGRVARVEQALDDGLFPQRIETGRWQREDVLREYGAPARIIQVHNFAGDIWIWRYLQGPIWRLLFIDIDHTGLVRGWSTGDEGLPDVPDSR